MEIHGEQKSCVLSSIIEEILRLLLLRSETFRKGHKIPIDKIANNENMTISFRVKQKRGESRTH